MFLYKRKKLTLCTLLLGIVCMVNGCATVPPQQITSSYITQPPGAEETAVPIEPELSPEDTQIASLPGAGESSAPVTYQASNLSASPQIVELFYSGMSSMMGFADAVQSTIYEDVMEALPAVISLCWPSAETNYYRYNTDVVKNSMQLSKEQLLKFIGEPYYYLESPLTKQPARVKREGESIITDAENMNEPMASFYDATGVLQSALRSSATGTQVAVAASDTAALTLIVTDLHELRMDDGGLLSTLNEYCLKTGRAIGIAAFVSEFSGYIPDIGANNTAFVWGAPPTGTLDYLLDFTEYQVGVSIDPEQRDMASRPFYILVIGEQSAVNTTLTALEERLNGEFSANNVFKMRTAVFGSGYVLEDYTLSGNMRYISGQGVTAVAQPSAPGGVERIELKASQQARYLEWELDYQIHPSDPRGTDLIAENFTFEMSALSSDGTATILPNLRWEIIGKAGSVVTLKLRLELPQGILAKGDYTLEIVGSLAAPPELPGTEWLTEFGVDLDGTQLYDMEQGVLDFDGSRTLFLSRLINTLGQANLGRLGVAPLGSVLISLTVYA